MNVALTGLPLPLRLRPAVAISDDGLVRFCAANDTFHVERETDGELLIMSPSGNETSSRNIAVLFELELWNRQAERGVVFDSNTGFTLPDGSMRSPDAAWLSLPRWSALKADERERFGPVCPEFVVELVSPSDLLPELERKMEAWIASGAALGWLINPFARTVTLYRTYCAPETLRGVTHVRGEGPVDGFVLPTNRIFTSPLPA